MSFSVSASRRVATNILNPRSAIRIASSIRLISLASFTARWPSTTPSTGTNVTFGASDLSASSSPSVIRERLPYCLSHNTGVRRCAR